MWPIIRQKSSWRSRKSLAGFPTRAVASHASVQQQRDFAREMARLHDAHQDFLAVINPRQTHFTLRG